jgi:hypothetical protein
VLERRVATTRWRAGVTAARVALLVAWAALAGANARAEPYLAVQSGLRCASCHVNQTGGGMRTPAGHAFAQTQLAAYRPEPTAGWDGRIGPWFALGANVRADTRTTEAAGAPRQTESFDDREARLYLSAMPIAERLTLYLDQYLGPGASTNREAFVLYRAADGGHYLKAGRFYLPFGWRLQDNSALVRAETAIDMVGPDRGVEGGWDHGAWSVQLAISNGTFGEAEVDDGKQVSLQLAHLGDAWRLGLAANVNDQAIGDRSAVGLFGGMLTGPVAWLAEVAAVEDRSAATAGGRARRATAWLLEGNWRAAQGHNLKFSAEGVQPERGTVRQTRASLVYEFTPLPFLQLRAGARRYDGPAQFAQLNRRVVFLELHGFL